MKPFKTKSVFFILILISLPVAVARGQDFWEKKPYQKWSEEECRKLLGNSPWAQSHTESQTFIQPLQTAPVSSPLGSDPLSSSARSPEPLAREDVGRARQSRPELTYQAQFRSAAPIRQAIVRLSQIKAKYDDMTAEQKTAFDKNSEVFLSKRFPDSLVIYISYGSNVPIDDREVARYWQGQTTESLKNFVFLISPGGEKIPLSTYAVEQGGSRAFQFVFPRKIDGRPLIAAKDKSLQLEFVHPKVRDQKEVRVLMSFKAEKMFVGGEAVY